MLARFFSYLRLKALGLPARSEAHWGRVAREIESAFVESPSEEALVLALKPILAQHGDKAANLPLRAVVARSMPSSAGDGDAATSRSGDSALFAAIALRLPLVFALLAPKADYFSVDTLGKTLLMRAVLAGNFEFTKFLAPKSDLSARSTYGLSVFENAVLSLEKDLTQTGRSRRLALFAILAKESAKRPPAEAQALLLSAFSQLNHFLSSSHWGALGKGGAENMVAESGLMKLFAKLVPAHGNLDDFLALGDPAPLVRQTLFPHWEALVLERQMRGQKSDEAKAAESSSAPSPGSSAPLAADPASDALASARRRPLRL